MRGQVTIFIILGLVIVISVVVLLMLRSAAAPKATPPAVQSDTTEANVCLSRVTRAAVKALQDDGMITKSEGGPIPDGTYDYLLANTHTASGYGPFLLGQNNYIGLCDPTGDNAIGKTPGHYFPCGPSAYEYFGSQSIQQQLVFTIDHQMRSCINSTGNAHVFIAEHTLTVTWDNPSIQYQDPVSLPPVWRAIEETVRRDVSDSTFIAGVTKLTCAGCENVKVTRTHTNPNHLDYSVNGQVIAGINFADRGILIQDGNAWIERAQPPTSDCTLSGCELLTPDEERPSVTYEQDTSTCHWYDKAGEKKGTLSCYPQLAGVKQVAPSPDSAWAYEWAVQWSQGCYAAVKNVDITDGSSFKIHFDQLNIKPETHAGWHCS